MLRGLAGGTPAKLRTHEYCGKLNARGRGVDQNSACMAVVTTGADTYGTKGSARQAA